MVAAGEWPMFVGSLAASFIAIQGGSLLGAALSWIPPGMPGESRALKSPWEWAWLSGLFWFAMAILYGIAAPLVWRTGLDSEAGYQAFMWLWLVTLALIAFHFTTRYAWKTTIGTAVISILALFSNIAIAILAIYYDIGAMVLLWVTTGWLVYQVIVAIHLAWGARQQQYENATAMDASGSHYKYGVRHVPQGHLKHFMQR